MLAFRTASGPRSLFLLATLVIGLGAPAVAMGSQTDSATPAATPDAPDQVESLTTASVVPADAPLYVAVTADPTSAQWVQADALIQRAGLDDIRADLIAEFQAELQSEIDVPGGEDLSAFGGGEIGFAVTDAAAFMAMDDVAALPALPAASPETASPSSAPEPARATAAPTGFVAVIRAGNPNAAEDRARELVETQPDATVTETTYQGVTIVAAEPRYEWQDGIAYARLDDFLIVSMTAADLEPVIDVAAGDDPALSSADPFTRLRQELPGDILLYGFTNGPAFRAVVEPALAAAEAELGPTFPMDQALIGLDAYAGFAVKADDAGFRYDTISVPAAGATLPSMPANFDSTLDDRVPADSLLFVNGYDLGATVGPSLDAYGAFIAMAAAEDPTFPFPLPATVTDGGQAGAVFDLAGRFLAFNPRTDLIDNLVGEWAFALSVASPDPQGIGAVFVSGAGDELRLNDAVTKLAVWVNLLVIGGLANFDGGEAELFGDQPVGAHTEEVNGVLTQVIEIPIPDMGTSARLQWGVIDGELVFGVGDGFADYMAGPAASLADSPRYQAAMDALPAEHNSIFYLDLAQTIELAQPFVEQELHTHDAAPDLSAIQAFAAVGFERDDLQGSSTILLIGEQ